MTAESRLLRQILRDHGARPDLRLFRNNTGQAWVGRAQRVSAYIDAPVGPGDVIIRNARPLHAGLCEGSSDLIGWRALEITPALVGTRIAQFTALEVKTGRQRPTAAQQRFLDAVARFGGLAAVVRAPDEIDRVLTEARR